MITYRPLEGLEEYRRLLDIQRAVWGFGEVEVIPARLFLISAEAGGQVIGAFDGEKLIGYVFAIPGFKGGAGRHYLHSHMLGVLEEYRNRGIGRQLKFAQQQDALARGIGLIEWTFDPLELKNAYLNIEVLGVVIRRYLRNVYGVTTSKLHSGMPTDRCVAEWYLDHPHTQAVQNKLERPSLDVDQRIAVPADIANIRVNDLPQALKIQADVREDFEQSFAAGLTVVGFDRTEDAGVYLLGKWQ
jgi:predicted GNAT superfamily acetyltransferase